MSEEKNKFIALYHFLDKPQDFNLKMNYYEFRDELKNLLDLYQKEKEKNKEYENKIKSVLELIDTKPYTAYTLYGDILYDDENIRELLEER